jgi:hypothetical protein
LQEDLKKFVSEPQPPLSGIEIPKEGKAKDKERRVVGDGDCRGGYHRRRRRRDVAGPLPAAVEV